MNMQTVKKEGSQKARNSAARLLAVQAVYQMHKNDQDAQTVIREFLEHRAGMEVDGEKMVPPDEDHFIKVVKGVEENIEQLQDMVKRNRSEGAGQAEPLLKAILLCGAYELMVLQSIDNPVIISDYLHVTHAFYDEKEGRLVNGLLDSISQTVRD